MRCEAAITEKPSSANSALRWSMPGMSMARSTRSGMLVGPGICRKCLPVCSVIYVLPGILALQGSNITIWRACPLPGGCRQWPSKPAFGGFARARCGIRVRLGLDHLEMRRGICLVTSFQELHRRIDAAGAVRHARGGKTHLDARQRSHQGQLVALAEVADAKYLAR